MIICLVKVTFVFQVICEMVVTLFKIKDILSQIALRVEDLSFEWYATKYSWEGGNGWGQCLL